MFEVENPDEVMASNGTVKPKLVERGPYAYTEDRFKIEVSQESEDENHIR